MTLDELEKLLGFSDRNLSVAIVGNAASQFGRRLGAEIDTHDIVVRLNYGEIKRPEDQGVRTDIVGCSDPKISLALIDDMFNPRMVIWLTRKEPSVNFFNSPSVPFYINDIANGDLAAQLVAPFRPSSGFLAAYLFRSVLGYENVSLYGFDFFLSKTFYHRKSTRFWRKPKPSPHSGQHEHEAILRLGVSIKV